MLETYGHLLFLGLIVSKPHLVIFLEQKRELWDVKRKKTVASPAAVASHGTQNFLPKPCIEASSQNVSLGTWKHHALENLHLMINWDSGRKNEAHQKFHEGRGPNETSAHMCICKQKFQSNMQTYIFVQRKFGTFGKLPQAH
ncbi:putative protein ZNF720 [Leopardus geoffroyi]|uniref:putative protein ZNF720 n=1 Tax=Leopardus geoffroyi TaxID=46844 RepID=UPI001E264A83|nr:putative protein ZNF720 [Leopardus geoffroyi]